MPVAVPELEGAAGDGVLALDHQLGHPAVEDAGGRTPGTGTIAGRWSARPSALRELAVGAPDAERWR